MSTTLTNEENWSMSKLKKEKRQQMPFWWFWSYHLSNNFDLTGGEKSERSKYYFPCVFLKAPNTFEKPVAHQDSRYKMV